MRLLVGLQKDQHHMKKRALPFVLAAFCSGILGCTSKDVASASDPLPTLPHNAKIDILKYADLPSHEFDGLIRINAVLSLFHQAGAAASHGECAEAKAFLSTAQSTPFWFNQGNAALTPIVMKKLFIANMVGQNARARCSQNQNLQHPLP